MSDEHDSASARERRRTPAGDVSFLHDFLAHPFSFVLAVLERFWSTCGSNGTLMSMIAPPVRETEGAA
ncbi:MAG: hypothetical protein ACRD2J_02785 [Thermoanaerobaculia bacterium]